MCCETLRKHLNENLKIHVIFEFCYKVIVVFETYQNFFAITLKSSGSDPKHLETHFVPSSHKIFNIYSRAQNCNENKLAPMCFLLNSPSYTLAK